MIDALLTPPRRAGRHTATVHPSHDEQRLAHDLARANRRVCLRHFIERERPSDHRANAACGGFVESALGEAAELRRRQLNGLGSREP